MDSKEQKAEEMATRLNIYRKGRMWVVPSETKLKVSYEVTHHEPRTCTCEDFVLRQEPCKHILAVGKRIEGVGRPPRPQVTVQRPPRTYRPATERNWRAYNEAQVQQRPHFRRLLADLCDEFAPALERKIGRRGMSWAEIVFLTADKVYSTLSTRRYMGDCYALMEDRKLARSVHYNTLSRYLGRAALTPILIDLIEKSASPLRGVETDFSIDGTGIGRSKFRRWYHEKDQVMKERKEWMKVHLICGNQTNVVASVIITEPHAHEATYLPELLNKVAKQFRVLKLCGDKAFSSEENLKAIDEVGAIPLIPFKENANPLRGGIWRKMFYFYQYRRDEFLKHYHRRSNVESTFAAIKGLFGNGVKSKLETAIRNEILLKILCFNICCVVRSHYELGVEMEFARPEPAGGS